ncbi:hypothetical protein [Streptomyces solicathayae]|uniref:Secreted protein n=1 Tax=Streptomyces solicathayae TaxID=3081768 RepID=A0ABZ0M0K1_9ACTN|nr:hypothetical protein [Streptomyces sp. HUAS YS2]WOX25234.1 hypothetical protein R2D22_29210 [Streptomyces sp. HUAS YS2]
MPTPRMLLWAGLAAVAAGAVLCAVGWYGISGERFTERQLPWLASSTVPGAALVVAGAVLVAVGAVTSAGRPAGAAEAKSEWESEWDSDRESESGIREEPPAPSSEEPPVRVPGGTLAHRPDCPLVAGRPEAVPVGDDALDPCPVCEPWPR